MSVRVLVLDPVHDDGMSLLHARPDIEVVHLPDPTPDTISPEMEKADILILRGRYLPEEDFERAGRLRLVSRHGVGCDNLDLPRLKERQIGVAVAADANAISVAEHAFALMLAGAKNLLVADRSVRGNNWAKRGAMDAFELSGRTVLVVGFGRIGRGFAERAAAFGMNILVHDPFLPANAVLASHVTRADDLDAALGEADVVSLHLPMSEANRDLFDAARFARMRPGALLVNTARGGIVNEHDLADALDRGRPGRYATDVLADEPPKTDNPLLGREDVILCPHSAAMTAEGVIRMATRSAQNVLDYLDGTLAPDMTVVEPTPFQGDAR